MIFNLVLARFGLHFDTILEQFWGRKPIQNHIEFLESFWEWFWVSAGTLQSEKPWFSLEGCSKSRVDLFAPGRLRDRFWEAKWSQNWGQELAKSRQKSMQKLIPKLIDFCWFWGCILDPKMEPKLYQQSLKNQTNEYKNFDDFWVPRGAPTGSVSLGRRRRSHQKVWFY